jgi:hypothetical protein
MARYLVIGLLAAILALPLYGQEEADDFIHRDFQLTFMMPPLSTNGVQFPEVVNCYSLNTFIGMSAGTECLELGGFININKAYMRGAQMAGFINAVGLTPRAGYPSHGVQVAGFGNFLNSSFEGANMAGFANLITRSASGMQAAGFANVTNLTANSLQLAGFANIGREVDSTIQLAGFSNIAVEGTENSQASGFFNMAEGIRGFQVSGFVNIAQKVKGTQIAGFINICDTIEGIPLGMINIVRSNGYRALEISNSDFNFFQLSYKMGVEPLYVIYSMGKPTGGLRRWDLGLGLGTTFPFEIHYRLNLEAIVYQEMLVNHPDASAFLKMPRLNMINQIRAIISRTITESTSAFLAPTFNIGIAGDPELGDPLTDDMMPYWKIAPVSSAKKRVRMWFGFSAGLIF